MAKFLLPVFMFLIFSVPVFTTFAPFVLVEDKWFRMAWLMAAPFVFGLTYVLTAGGLSMPFRKAVFPGVFPRDLSHRIYGPRRLYAIGWTAIYYFTPLYYVFLSFAPLKKLLFRMFGYKFDLDFTIYPDTWLRDLPCVKFESGDGWCSKEDLNRFPE